MWSGVFFLGLSPFLYLSYLAGFELEEPLFVKVFYLLIPLVLISFLKFANFTRKSPGNALGLILACAGISILIFLADYIISNPDSSKKSSINPVFAGIWFALLAILATIRTKK